MKRFLSTVAIAAALTLSAVVVSAQTLTPGFENWDATEAFHVGNDITATHNDSPQPWLPMDGSWATDPSGMPIFVPNEDRPCSTWGMFPAVEGGCTYKF